MTPVTSNDGAPTKAQQLEKIWLASYPTGVPQTIDGRASVTDHSTVGIEEELIEGANVARAHRAAQFEGLGTGRLPLFHKMPPSF